MKKKSSEFIIKTSKYKVKDIYLNVAEVGKGEALIFIHGWSNSWIGWTLLAKELAPHYKLYMLDLPGFGDSDVLPNYSLEIINEYVSYFIDKYVPNPRAIVGASSGTFVASYVALANDYKFDIILIGTILNRRKTKLIKDIYAMLLSFSANSKLAHQAAEMIIKNPYSAYFIEKYIHAYQFNKKKIDLYSVPGRKKVKGKSYIQLGVAIMEYIFDKELEIIPNRTLLIFGSDDKYVSKKTADNFLKNSNNPNLSVSIIEEAGHSPSYEQPEKTGEVIREFLSALDIKRK
ncbi:MAG: alpha/beta hydrolase [Candidatus Levybacteria bacterium]|nr:alpha/beta hydrolase [Candidatus Levybacteria bacterium]